MGASLYYWGWLNDGSPPWTTTLCTPKLIQAQFHTYIINHYIIKQEVTITVSVQEFLIVDFPSRHFCGAPSDGRRYAPSAHTGSVYWRARKHRGVRSLNQKRVWTYKLYLSHIVLKSLSFTWKIHSCNSHIPSQLKNTGIPFLQCKQALPA